MSARKTIPERRLKSGDLVHSSQLARISRELLTEPDGPTQLRRIVQCAVEILSGCDDASIELSLPGGGAEAHASTSATAAECGALKGVMGEGPGPQAIRREDFYLIQDVGKETRWPTWAEQIAERGMASALSVRLSDGPRTLGFLSVFSHTPFTFSRRDISDALVFARHMAAVLATAEELRGLRTALQTRHVIGLAQGILMDRYDMPADRAFEVLRRYSTRSNTKLRDVAQALVSTGELPPERVRPRSVRPQRGRIPTQRTAG